MSENQYTPGSCPSNTERTAPAASAPVLKTERVLSWLLTVLSFFFIRSFAVSHSAVGAFVTTVLFVASAGVYMYKAAVRVRLPGVLCLLLCAVFSVSYLLYDNDFLRSLVFLYNSAVFLYGIYFIASARKREFMPDDAVLDLLSSVFVAPFCSFTQLFRCMFTGKKASRGFFLVMLGLLLSVLPTCALGLLLSRADEAFFRISSELFDFGLRGVLKNALYYIIGIPAAMYAFGAMYSAAHGKASDKSSNPESEGMSRLRFFPYVTAYSATVPILLIYALFFASQSVYLFSGFGDILPDGMTYAQYARRGFFELCAAAAVNLLIILFLSVFTKRPAKESGGKSAVYKIICTTLSIFTLGIIAIALSKMLMYIKSYGLTPLRVYVTWFTVLLAVVFVFVLIKLFFRSFRVLAFVFCAFTMLFGVLTLSDVDAAIARYNIDCYISGQHEKLDVSLFYSLSDSAVPRVAALYTAEGVDPEVSRQAEVYLKTIYNRHEQSGGSSLFDSISSRRAHRVLQELFAKRQ